MYLIILISVISQRDVSIGITSAYDTATCFSFIIIILSYMNISLCHSDIVLILTLLLLLSYYHYILADKRLSNKNIILSFVFFYHFLLTIIIYFFFHNILLFYRTLNKKIRHSLYLRCSQVGPKVVTPAFETARRSTSIRK
jgi:hypothetical protein